MLLYYWIYYYTCPQKEKNAWKALHLFYLTRLINLIVWGPVSVEKNQQNYLVTNHISTFAGSLLRGREKDPYCVHPDLTTIYLPYSVAPYIFILSSCWISHCLAHFEKLQYRTSFMTHLVVTDFDIAWSYCGVYIFTMEIGNKEIYENYHKMAIFI